MEEEKLKIIIDNITIAGFENFGYDDVANVCHLMNTNNPLKWFQINLEINSLKDYTYLIIRAKINFTTVTKIINDALQIEYNVKLPFSWDNSDTIVINEELFQKINSEEIRPVLKHTFTNQNIEKFYSQIQYLYNDFLFPFSKNYPEIETIDEIIIKNEPFHNWSKYLPGETVFKALVIMKICKNNQYNEFLNDYKSNIENAINNGNSRYLPYYKQLIKVTESLERGDYKKFL